MRRETELNHSSHASRFTLHASRNMHIHEFQKLIEDIYLEKDSNRGIEKSFLWLVEEVGELAEAIREGDLEQQKLEFGDCLAWLVTIASMAGINMEEASSIYHSGCPKCKTIPCKCKEKKRT